MKEQSKNAISKQNKNKLIILKLMISITSSIINSNLKYQLLVKDESTACREVTITTHI
jgi:hypothetical protein